MRYCMKHIQTNWNSPAPQNGKAGANTVVSGVLFTAETTETILRLIE